MRLNGFRCDGCGNEHLLEADFMAQSMWDALPLTWYMVSKGSDKERNSPRRAEPWLFCSLICLRQHPLAREQEVL